MQIMKNVHDNAAGDKLLYINIVYRCRVRVPVCVCVCVCDLACAVTRRVKKLKYSNII